MKSSTKYKADEHLPDIAFQVYVLGQAGLAVGQASLMHLNSDCRHPDLSNLFALTDVTKAVQDHLTQVNADVATMRQLITQPEKVPSVRIGRHCRKPYECPFHIHCWQGITDQTIYHIPYLKRPREAELEANGIQYVRDIPSGFTPGDKRAAAFVETVQRQIVSVEYDAIQTELEQLIYPLYFFDFETIDYAIPAFTGCKPYQQVPFQYSCHILEADGHLTHCDYLHTAADDPREALVISLLDHIGGTGHLVAYNISFERGILRHLAEQFLDYAEPLEQMAERLWDQLAIFRRHYQDYRFGGSNSPKSVLPVVVPALSYKMLAVQNGAQAQALWEEMIAEQETAVKQKMIKQLRDYCHLDTLAMVEIHRALLQG